MVSSFKTPQLWFNPRISPSLTFFQTKSVREKMIEPRWGRKELQMVDLFGADVKLEQPLLIFCLLIFWKTSQNHIFTFLFCQKVWLPGDVAQHPQSLQPWRHRAAVGTLRIGQQAQQTENQPTCDFLKTLDLEVQPKIEVVWKISLWCFFMFFDLWPSKTEATSDSWLLKTCGQVHLLLHALRQASQRALRLCIHQFEVPKKHQVLTWNGKRLKHQLVGKSNTYNNRVKKKASAPGPRVMSWSWSRAWRSLVISGNIWTAQGGGGSFQP